MKKKKWLISLSIIVAVLILVTASAGILIYKGYDVSTGVYLESKDGAAILICEKTPIKMSNRTERELFDSLNIGDKILVFHDGIAESYPARTGAYAVFKINNGTTGAIPPSVVDELIELGWIETAEDVEVESPSGESVNDVEN